MTAATGMVIPAITLLFIFLPFPCISGIREFPGVSALPRKEGTSENTGTLLSHPAILALADLADDCSDDLIEDDPAECPCDENPFEEVEKVMPQTRHLLSFFPETIAPPGGKLQHRAGEVMRPVHPGALAARRLVVYGGGGHDCSVSIAVVSRVTFTQVSRMAITGG